MKVKTQAGTYIPVYTLYCGKGCVRMTVMREGIYCCTHHREMKERRSIFRKERKRYV